MLNSNKTDTGTETDTSTTFFNSREDPLLSIKEAARYVRMSPGYLAVLDCTKSFDLKPVKIRGRVYYYKSVLDDFLNADLKP